MMRLKSQWFTAVLLSDIQASTKTSNLQQIAIIEGYEKIQTKHINLSILLDFTKSYPSIVGFAWFQHSYSAMLSKCWDHDSYPANIHSALRKLAHAINGDFLSFKN